MKRAVIGFGLLLGLVAGGLLFVGLARAGMKSGADVTLTDTEARGAMGTARNSGDSNQTIGCRVDGAPTYTFTACWARDAAGTYRDCTTEDPNIFKAAQAVTSDSYLWFTFDGGTCTYLLVSQSSSFAPK